MSKLKYKNDEYSLAELLKLRTISPLHKEGDVLDQETGEILDIQDIHKWNENYIDELFQVRKKYGTKDTAMVTGQMKKVAEIKWIEELQTKFDEGNIDTEDLKTLIELKLKKEGRKQFELSFRSFYIRNKQKEYPKELTFNDIGRYDKLLKYLTKYSDLRSSNRKDANNLKSLKITEELDLSDKRFFQFMNKLQSLKLLKFIKESNGDLIIFINPVYSYMMGEVDYTIYTMFKEDINEYLTKEEIEYLKRIHDSSKIKYTNLVSCEDV